MQHQLHKWNTSFAWQPTSGSRRCISDEQARSYDERGFFAFENAFSRDEMARVIAEIDPFEAKLTDFLRKQKDGRIFIADAEAITFTTHLVTRTEGLRAFCASPVFRDLCCDLIGANVRLYWDQAVYKKPKPERIFPWHQDNGYTYIEPQQYLTCWVALTDATEENGCPWVVPGVHELGTLAHWTADEGLQCLKDPEDAIAIPLRAGDCAVFSSLTPHCTGPNRSNEVRKAYIVQFAPDGVVTFTWGEDGTRVEVPQNDPLRQFLVASEETTGGSSSGE